jgi:hypothetical protein
MEAKNKPKAAAHRKVLVTVAEIEELLPQIPTADSDASNIQRIFNSYADCEFLTGEAVKDDNGTVLQSAAWLCENRFDDFLDEISYALVAGGVSREALMRVYLRHALRVLKVSSRRRGAVYAGYMPDGRRAARRAAQLSGS